MNKEQFFEFAIKKLIEKYSMVRAKMKEGYNSVASEYEKDLEKVLKIADEGDF